MRFVRVACIYKVSGEGVSERYMMCCFVIVIDEFVMAYRTVLYMHSD